MLATNIEPMFEDGSAATRLAWVLDQHPSAATHVVLESLVDTPLPRDLQVLAAKAWDRQYAAMGAVCAATRVAATVCNDGPDAQDDADAELALALRRTDREIAHQLHADRTLMSLPVLFGVFRAGDCTLRHVSAFIDITREVERDDVTAIDAAVSMRAASMTVSGLRRVVRKAMARLDSRSPEDKEKARRPRIGVRCYPQPDGLITVSATMPAADGVAFASELNRRADAARTTRRGGPRYRWSSTGGRWSDCATTRLSCSATGRSPPPTCEQCSVSRTRCFAVW